MVRNAPRRFSSRTDFLDKPNRNLCAHFAVNAISNGGEHWRNQAVNVEAKRIHACGDALIRKVFAAHHRPVFLEHGDHLAFDRFRSRHNYHGGIGRDHIAVRVSEADLLHEGAEDFLRRHHRQPSGLCYSAA